MGIEGEYGLIVLMPGQVVDNDPDGLVEADKEILRELMKPKTIKLTFRIIKEAK